ncbi:neutral/alkaline non-lysosomal ceramidase N-terminal domain-containing protein [Actinopolymorpha sp. B17G11]|uniref:neutral/alkaline non-lysosomal ceramidase N-terminal domain-containing protein n=1 Tax=Actinopolymorpha sp. B17G11 TaxID=3160861 RepID=UPI0032E4015F
MSGERTVRAGAAVVDVTPPAGTTMSGYAARLGPATGVHDPITVRAVCVEDTALVAVDVVGLHEDLCATVARRCPLPDEGVRIHATHTHSGPASVPGRLGGGVDAVWLAKLEDACVEAIAAAARRRVPVQVLAGYGAEVDVARNRRRTDGPVDHSLPVVRLVADDGASVAVVMSYACHPVVLGADNTLLSADYPGVVRRLVEARHPGCVALFLTGCAGDANTGHAASASVTQQASMSRTFAAAEQAGETLAAAVLDARLVAHAGPVRADRTTVDLDIADDPGVDGVDEWRRLAADPGTDPGLTALMRYWLDWSERIAGRGERRWPAPVGVLDWAGVRIVTLPGEPFAQIGLDIRAAVGQRAGPAAVTMVAGYTDGCPGYLPTSTEYAFGGYEVEEAHRYYGLRGPFDPGSAERLVEAATALARS